MKITSAEANKILKKLQNEMDTLLSRERDAKEFVAATTENVDEVRPDYDFSETQEKTAELRGLIVELKHAINVFNNSCDVPGTNLTIDRVLVMMPLISDEVRKLSSMKDRLPKFRYRSESNLIEYKYLNYDAAVAAALYEKEYAELAQMQMALDKVNTTVVFEIDDKYGKYAV